MKTIMEMGSFVKGFFLKIGACWRGFFFDRYPQAFHPCIFRHIEDLNDSVEDHALICPDNHRSRFVKGNEGFQLCL